MKDGDILLEKLQQKQLIKDLEASCKASLAEFVLKQYMILNRRNYN